MKCPTCSGELEAITCGGALHVRPYRVWFCETCNARVEADAATSRPNRDYPRSSSDRAEADE